MKQTLNLRIYLDNPIALLKSQGKYHENDTTPTDYAAGNWVGVRCVTSNPININNEDLSSAVEKRLKYHLSRVTGVQVTSDLSFDNHTLYLCKVNGDVVYEEIYLYVEKIYEIPKITVPQYTINIDGRTSQQHVVTEYVLRQMLIDNALGLVEFSVLSREPEVPATPENEYFAEVKNGCFNGTPIDLEGKTSLSLLTDLKFKLLKLRHKQTKSE